MLERAGKITELEEQVRYEVIPKKAPERAAHYVADFRYRQNGELVVEDTKGFKTTDYILKRKLMNVVHGIRILET